jgi:hypothetical protein
LAPFSYGSRQVAWVPPSTGTYPFTVFFRQRKSPCISTGAFFNALVNHLDELNTATFFAVRYWPNTKSFSPHWRSLLSISMYVDLLLLLYNYQMTGVKYNRI